MTKYKNTYKGVNSRLDEIQAAMLSVKLKYLNNEINRRREITSRYLDEINNSLIVLPENTELGEHVWHLFVVQCDNRDALQTHMNALGVATLIHYPLPPHKQKAYHEWNENKLPITELLHDRVLSIPVDPTMTDSDISKVIVSINQFKN